MSIKKLYRDFVMETSKVPSDARTLEEIAEKDLDCCVDKAREIVNKLVKANRVERIVSKRVNENGALVSMIFYREISPTKPAAKTVAKVARKAR